MKKEIKGQEILHFAFKCANKMVLLQYHVQYFILNKIEKKVKIL